MCSSRESARIRAHCASPQMAGSTPVILIERSQRRFAFASSLLASLESKLDCVIAGIPAADFLRMIRHTAPSFLLRAASKMGLELEDPGQVEGFLLHRRSVAAEVALAATGGTLVELLSYGSFGSRRRLSAIGAHAGGGDSKRRCVSAVSAI